jgi:hypothetical protein
METIQTRALVCLNNMLTTIEIDQLGGPDALALLWNKIMEIAFQNKGNAFFQSIHFQATFPHDVFFL